MRATWLCVRFPFLYPRNRFTGHFYNNWELQKKAKICYADAYVYDVKKGRTCVNRKKALMYLYYNVRERVEAMFHCIPSYTELNAFEHGMPGWYKAFGKDFLRELRRQLIKDRFLFRFRITDWKEKLGEMRLYCAYASADVYDIIEKYTKLSARTCIVCGKPAVFITQGYILPYCYEHLPEYSRDCGSYETIEEHFSDVSEELPF